MMDYKWNKKDIKNKINELKSKSILSKNEKEDLYLLKDMLRTMNGTRITSDLSKYKVFFSSNKQLINVLSEDFKTYFTEFQHKAIIDSLEDIVYQDFNEIYKSSLDIPISFLDQKELIYKYFSDGILLDKHKDLFNLNYFLLQLTKQNINETITVGNSNYIVVNNNETVKDFNTLCHELGHYDESIITNNRMLKERFNKDKFKYDNLSEISSIFYELVSIDILEKEKLITPHDGMSLHNYSFTNKTCQGDYYNYADVCVRNNEIDKKDNFYIRKEFEYPSSIAMYYYSFLIACNLYEQYKEDPEKAKFNLWYILKNITPENEEKILNAADANPQDLDKLRNYTKRLRSK